MPICTHDDPCDDWSSLPVPHQRSLEPLVFWDATGLDTLWFPQADRDGQPVAEADRKGAR